MRYTFPTLLALVPMAGLLSGCAMAPLGNTNSIASATPARTVKGKAYGGQLAVSGALIAVYTYGTLGYGSPGTLLATSTTDSAGDFNFTFTCPSANVPVYALSIGGDAGFGTNTALVEGAALGTCSAADAAPFLTINEVSTTVLAFSLSHFFSAALPDGTSNDHFGSPASLNPAIALVNESLIPTLINVPNGSPNPSTATFTNEASKIVTVANILANCVNTAGSTSTACQSLFAESTPPGGSAPANTLEAAINMALYPQQNVPQLFNLSGSGAFDGGLTVTPSDWTLAVSYTAPTFGLGLNTRTVSTLDIDNTGRVWFPTNVAGAVGIADFDPGTSSFSSVYTAPGMVRPEQVAIDLLGNAWVTDVGSPVVAGFPVNNPGAPTVLSLPNTTSTALTILNDDTVRVAIVSDDTQYPSLAQVTHGNTPPAYAPLANTTVSAAGFFGASLAADTIGGSAVSANQGTNPGSFYLYLDPADNPTFITSQTNDSGQLVFTGTDYVSARAGYSVQGDGLCIYTQLNCYSMQNEQALRHPSGMAIDGAASLWLADELTPDVQQIQFTNGSYLDANTVPNNLVYPHGSNDGGTLQHPTGIGVDNTGNIWVSNIGCYGNGCTPGAFVLSEIIGAAAPTVTPVSSQLVISPGIPPAMKTVNRLPK